MTWVISQMRRGNLTFWTGAIVRNAPKRTLILAKAAKFSSDEAANKEAGQCEALGDWKARRV